MDHWVDRPEVQARQRAQPTGTNRPTRTTHPHAHPPAPAPERAGAGGEPDPASTTQPRTNPPHPPQGGAGHQGPRTTTPPPSRRPQRAGKRPDPYRTRKLSPPAPMVLPPPGSGRVGHHRNTHHRPAPGGRPNHASTPRGPNPQTHPYNTTKLMVALSCADHLRCAGPRRSDPRSRGRSARPGVRGAAAPGAGVREIVG